MSHSDPCAKEQTNQPNQTIEQQAEGSGGRVRQRMLMDDEGEMGGNEAFSLQRPVTYGRVTYRRVKYGTPAPDWPQRVPRFHNNGMGMISIGYTTFLCQLNQLSSLSILSNVGE